MLIPLSLFSPNTIGNDPCTLWPREWIRFSYDLKQNQQQNVLQIEKNLQSNCCWYVIKVFRIWFNDCFCSLPFFLRLVIYLVGGITIDIRFSPIVIVYSALIVGVFHFFCLLSRPQAFNREQLFFPVRCDSIWRQMYLHSWVVVVGCAKIKYNIKCTNMCEFMYELPAVMVREHIATQYSSLF